MRPGCGAASLTAIASANYVARRLDEHFPVLYTGANDLVAHECILDLRGITKATGVTVDDVAKRLADYGFHAPTMSFPVAGTLMVEPTESESLAEIDEFCEAMIAIHGEIERVAAGEWPVDDSPLRGAPHTAECLLVSDWDRPYTREQAAYPLGKGFRPKVWPPVRRIDGAYGDRNLVCSCPPVEAFCLTPAPASWRSPRMQPGRAELATFLVAAAGGLGDGLPGGAVGVRAEVDDIDGDRARRVERAVNVLLQPVAVQRLVGVRAGGDDQDRIVLALKVIRL